MGSLVDMAAYRCPLLAEPSVMGTAGKLWETHGTVCMANMSFLSNNEGSTGRMSVAFNRYMYMAWYRNVSWSEREPLCLRRPNLDKPDERAYLDVDVELAAFLLLHQLAHSRSPLSASVGAVGKRKPTTLIYKKLSIVGRAREGRIERTF